MTVQQWLNNSSVAPLLPPYFQTGDIDIGLVTFVAEQHLFRIRTLQGESAYEIESDRLLSATAFVDWVWQLHSKSWVTPQHMKDFLDCLLCWIHREHKQFPQPFYQVTWGMIGGLDQP